MTIKNNINKNSLPEIPVFFATDENYAPFLATTLTSIKTNANQDYFYCIYILHKNLREEDIKKLEKFDCEFMAINFVNVSEELEKIEDVLALRDYFTSTTYFRFFIQKLCPQYDKALYLDADIIVQGDLSELYNHELGDNLVGACVEDVMLNFEIFGDYVEKAVGIKKENYFNAGIMLMNLKKFREEDVLTQFVKLNALHKFEVVQDEDYLNVICKDKVLLIDSAWNKAPIEGTELDAMLVKLIHYKLMWKPWKYDKIIYGDLFWFYAYQTEYFNDILNMKLNYTADKVQKDQEGFLRLQNMAKRDIEDLDNYRRKVESKRI